MTVKEASKTVEGYLPDCDTKKFVLDILARAEPKKTVIGRWNEKEAYRCPQCDCAIGYTKEGFDYFVVINFCDNCGQAFDWSDL